MELVQKLIDAGLLTEQDRETVTAAINQKINESVAAAEEKVRSELASRYESDKASMINSIDKLVGDVVTKFNEDKQSSIAKLDEAKADYQSKVDEVKEQYKQEVSKRLAVFEKFMVDNLSNEIKSLKMEHAELAKTKKQYAKAISESRQAVRALSEKNVAKLNSEKKKLQESTASKVEKITSFVSESLKAETRKLLEEKAKLRKEKALFEQKSNERYQELKESTDQKIDKIARFVATKLEEELKDFEQDRDALVKKRIQLVTEAKDKLAETQKNFVASASKQLKVLTKNVLSKELKELHEDIQRSKENDFSRALVESFGEMYKKSIFNDASESSKIEKMLEATKAEMESLKEQLKESEIERQVEARKAKLAEARAVRKEILADLLAPLSSEKRQVMASLLESVKTESLRSSFKRYLPTVISEGKRINKEEKTRVLTESKTLTGDQQVKQIQPDSDDSGISEILARAGLTN